MTEELKKALDDLDAARKQVNVALDLVNKLRDTCRHHIVPDDPKWPDASDGICSDCGYKTGSWYCPDNAPSHVCEYTRDSGEWCIHCGYPYERL